MFKSVFSLQNEASLWQEENVRGFEQGSNLRKQSFYIHGIYGGLLRISSRQPLTDPSTKFDGSFLFWNELAKQIPWCQRGQSGLGSGEHCPPRDKRILFKLSHSWLLHWFHGKGNWDAAMPPIPRDTQIEEPWTHVPETSQETLVLCPPDMHNKYLNRPLKPFPRRTLYQHCGEHLFHLRFRPSCP